MKLANFLRIKPCMGKCFVTFAKKDMKQIFVLTVLLFSFSIVINGQDVLLPESAKSAKSEKSDSVALSVAHNDEPRKELIFTVVAPYTSIFFNYSGPEATVNLKGTPKFTSDSTMYGAYIFPINKKKKMRRYLYVGDEKIDYKDVKYVKMGKDDDDLWKVMIKFE